MTQFGVPSAFLLVGGYNLSGEYTFDLTEAIEQPLEQVNGLGDSWEAHKPVGIGIIKLEASDGIYSDAVDGSVAALQGTGNTKQLVLYGMSGQGGNNGQEARMLDGAFAFKWVRVSARDALTHAHAEYTIEAVFYRGVLLHGIVAETSDPGNTEGAGSVDNGASSAGGAIADLHLPALTLGGFTSFTVTVRHSADDITYANLVAFTTRTTIGAERVTVAGTVNRHLAIAWDFIGAGAGQSATPVVAIVRL